MAEFLSQGGFGVFVWASYGAALVLPAGELVHLVRQRRATVRRLAKLGRARGVRV